MSMPSNVLMLGATGATIGGDRGGPPASASMIRSGVAVRGWPYAHADHDVLRSYEPQLISATFGVIAASSSFELALNEPWLPTSYTSTPSACVPLCFAT